MARYSEVTVTKPGFYVYRIWAGDVCLYVGCVGERGPRRLSRRLAEHKRQKPWWSLVTRIDAAVLAGVGEVAAEESVQITELQPVHNKTLLRGNPMKAQRQRDRLRDRSEYYRERNRNPEQRRRKSALENARRRRRSGSQQVGPTLFD